MKNLFKNFPQLLLGNRFVFANKSPEKPEAPDPKTEKTDDFIESLGQYVSDKNLDNFVDQQTKETEKKGEIAVNKAKEETGKVTRMKEVLIVGNIVDENGNVNSTNYITKLAEQRGMEIEERLIPFSEQIDKYFSAKNNPLDEFLGKGATSKLIDQLATAYTKMIDSGNYEGVKDLCYDVNAYLTDFHGGYNSFYRKSTSRRPQDIAAREQYEKSVKDAANDLKGIIDKAVS